MKVQILFCLKTQTVTKVCVKILLERMAGNSAKVFSWLCVFYCYVCLNNFLPKFSYLFIITVMSFMATAVVSVGNFLGVIWLWDVYLIFTFWVSRDALRTDLSETKCSVFDWYQNEEVYRTELSQ